jgi:hypothetical protein
MASPAPLPLLRQATCPHCWHAFRPEDVLWVSAHADLLGDQRLGPDQPQRFLPTRFTADGQAIDARGFPCQALACPRCHLPLPRALLEMEPMFLSILGTPACGKSYYLAALTWQLRKVLPLFSLSFADVEPSINQALTDSEEALFLNPSADGFQLLARLIGKTKLHGEMYDIVSYGSQTVLYPRPYMFALQPTANHPRASRPGGQPAARVVCLYDNAGEHFQPGRETTAAPVTQHLARAELLLFLFDPTQDSRFHSWFPEKTKLHGEAFDGRAAGLTGDRGVRQELILLEAASRIRRTLGLAAHARHDRPLAVILTKCDAWAQQLPRRDWSEPWKGSRAGLGLETERIDRGSRELRTMLESVCPDLVQAAEGFAREVRYFAVSALGHAPRQTADGPYVRPADVRPIGVTVPVVYGLHRWLGGLVPGLKRVGASPPSTPMPQRPPEAAPYWWEEMVSDP